MARRKPLNLPPSRPEVIAFLREAKENPDDDTPRLILADWLEDRGDPRGEFVRLQATHKQHERAKAISELHKAEWLGELTQKGMIHFYRGLAEVTVHPRWFLGPAWRQFAGSETWEWVEELSLHDGVESTVLDRLVDSPLLPSI